MPAGRGLAPLADIPDSEPGHGPPEIEGWLAAHLPGVGRRRTAHEVCLYTMSPDGHFLVGLHPHDPQVALAAGFSGHGFKFASLIGEVLADLALDGRTSHPIGFLAPTRFQPD
jgi:glycine/D-amino acid oxidase-like deaminating enzyme